MCSMADLFHDDVPDSFLDEVFGVILATKMFNNHPDHTFIILTKRAERMHKYFTGRSSAELLKAWAYATDWVHVDDGDMYFHEYVESAVCHDWDENGRNSKGSPHKMWGYPEQLFPLSNLWLGVTAENQEQADKRIPILLQIPAAVRFVSIEPMLGPVDLIRLNLRDCGMTHPPDGGFKEMAFGHRLAPNIDWVICGGESGPGARPMHPDWARSLRDQCHAASVPYFFKQWGEWWPIAGDGISKPEYDNQFPKTPYCWLTLDGKVFQSGAKPDALMLRTGKKNAGSLLDGQEWKQFPKVQP